MNLKLAINSILIDGVHAKFFPYWQKAFNTEDVKLTRQLRAMQNRSMKEFGIPQVFQHDQSRAVQILRTLPKHTTPIMKLKTLNKVTKAILESSPVNVEKQEALTSDELLPLLAFVIVKSDLPTLHSESEFMANLQIREVENLEYGYSLVTFQAALQYLQHESPTVEALSPEQKPKLAIKSKQPPSVVSPSEEETEGLYRAMSMPESYFKVIRQTPSPRETYNEIMERRKSLSTEVFSIFENRIKDDDDKPKAPEVKKKEPTNTLNSFKPMSTKKGSNPKLGDLLSSILDD